MTLRLGSTIRSAMANAAAAVLDSGSGAAVVRIYTGAQPASVATAATGTLLVEIPLNDPGFAAAAAGVAAADVDPEVTADAIATGTAGWFRISDSTGTAHIDGAIPGEMTLTNTAITSGLPVTITSGTLTQPAS